MQRLLRLLSNLITVYKAEWPENVYASFDSFHQWMIDLQMRMPRDTPDDIKNETKLRYLDNGIDAISDTLNTLVDILSVNR